jgi:hypothetical protein
MFQVMIQSLQRSFESIVTTFRNMDVIPTFNRLCVKLQIEAYNIN